MRCIAGRVNLSGKKSAIALNETDQIAGRVNLKCRSRSMKRINAPHRGARESEGKKSADRAQ